MQLGRTQREVLTVISAIQILRGNIYFPMLEHSFFIEKIDSTFR